MKLKNDKESSIGHLDKGELCMLVNQNQLIKYAVKENAYSRNKKYNQDNQEFIQELFEYNNIHKPVSCSYNLEIPGFDGYPYLSGKLDLIKTIPPLDLQLNSSGYVDNTGFLKFENVNFIQRATIADYLRALYDSVRKDSEVPLSSKEILLNNITTYFNETLKEQPVKHLLLLQVEDIKENLEELGVKIAAINYIINKALFHNAAVDIASYKMDNKSINYTQNISFNNFPHIKTLVYIEGSGKYYDAIINKHGHVYLQSPDLTSKQCLTMYPESCFKDDLLNLETLSREYSHIRGKTEGDIDHDIKVLLEKYKDFTDEQLISGSTNNQEYAVALYLRQSIIKAELQRERELITGSETYRNALVKLSTIQEYKKQIEDELLLKYKDNKTIEDIAVIIDHKRKEKTFENLSKHLMKNNSYINLRNVGEAIINKPKLKVALNKKSNILLNI